MGKSTYVPNVLCHFDPKCFHCHHYIGKPCNPEKCKGCPIYDGRQRDIELMKSMRCQCPCTCGKGR